MKLVEDKTSRALQERIVLKHANENSFGDAQNAGVRCRAIVEPNSIADLATELNAALL